MVWHLAFGIWHPGSLTTEGGKAMATYKRFEDLPVWQAAMDLADAV